VKLVCRIPAGGGSWSPAMVSANNMYLSKPVHIDPAKIPKKKVYDVSCISRRADHLFFFPFDCDGDSAGLFALPLPLPVVSPPVFSWIFLLLPVFFTSFSLGPRVVSD